ncbi:MAG: hypothetical protein QM484_07150 [Woeseiaceae bacterium]
MTELSCSNPDCRIAETGKCVEGLEISACPHQKKTDGVSNTATPEIVKDESKASLEHVDVLIASGDVLTISEATDVLCSGPSRVISVIGPQDAGKTTFGLSLYEAFQNGSFNTCSFAGSLTLPAFEQRCHNARVESRREHPETPRTSLSDGLGFLHLAIRSNGAERIELLISDRAGEYYTAVANSEENCDSLHEVSRADNVLFFLDGNKFASNERHGIKHELLMSIATLVENNVLSTGHQVSLVLSKFDKIVSLDNFEQIEKEFAKLTKNIRDRFGTQLGEIKSYKIAARSENNAVETRFGVFDILADCLRPRERIVHQPKSSQTFERSYHRLPETTGGQNK